MAEARSSTQGALQAAAARSRSGAVGNFCQLAAKKYLIQLRKAFSSLSSFLLALLSVVFLHGVSGKLFWHKLTQLASQGTPLALAAVFFFTSKLKAQSLRNPISYVFCNG